ncbi:hypothetical protein Bestia_00045 [Acinetobacter phage Bestia]|nr:hypothetical protein Bestia_00045 [Acinetobacter phage Bestia]
MAIKAVVIVDGDHITCNGYEIEEGALAFYISEIDGRQVAEAESLEVALKWCMEN